MGELDVFAVKDVMDVGNGEPLFFNFYYERYFKKCFVASNYGCKGVSDFLELIEEVAKVADSGLLEGLLPEDTPKTKFIKFVEHHRRERLRSFEAGDETAQLKFKPQCTFVAPDREINTEFRNGQFHNIPVPGAEGFSQPRGKGCKGVPQFPGVSPVRRMEIPRLSNVPSAADILSRA